MIAPPAAGSDAQRRTRFEQVVEIHRKALNARALKLCGNDRSIADDLVQETLLQAWRKLDSLADDARAVGWLIKILCNRWIDLCRRRTVVVAIAEVPDVAAEAEPKAMWEEVTVSEFHAAIDRLDEPYRSVIILRHIDGLANPAIAEKLGIPYATVGSRLHRAQKQLRLMIERRAEEDKPQ